MNIVSELENIIKTKDVVLNEDDIGGIGNILFKYMKIHGEKIAQIEADTGRSDTFASLLQKCTRTAISLKQRGIKKGDFVSLCSDHHLDACVPIIAAQFLGAVPFSLEPSLTARDCANLLKQIQPKIIFVRKRCEDMIKSSIKITKCSAQIVIFEDDFENQFLSLKPNEDAFEPLFIRDLDETAVIYFSSGSTGLPKPVCVKHYCLLAACEKLTGSGNTFLFGRTCEDEVFLSFSNWYWISSGWILIACTVEGACRILSNEFDPVNVWYFIDKYKITSMFLSPLKVIEFCESEQPEEVDISSLKAICYGGSALPEEYALKLRRKFPDVVSSQGYGQTEVGIITKFSNLDDERQLKLLERKPFSLGMPIEGIWYKVVDPETEKTLGSNQPGELRVKSRRLMNGYYNRDSKDCFDEDGFFKTGDILYYDQDFCFYFVQRLKELLKYREWHVFPSMLENILLQHPAVKNAVVIGKPHKVDGDHPMGVVILKENCGVTEEELLKFVHDKVEERQKLRAGIKFVKSYPLGVTGKINRNALKEIVLRS